MQYLAYKKSVEYLESLVNIPRTAKQKSAELRVKRMREFFCLLGNPEAGLKIVHITGTAGKGTLAGMIHAVLVAAGKQAGLYTSPHVTTAIERTKVGHKYISPQDFAKFVKKIRPAIHKINSRHRLGKVTYREAQIAVAFLYFKKMKCKWVVLEVGAGGKSDPTNFIAKAEFAVITNIGLSHTALLGKTLRAIALDKAAIIKKGSVFWTSEARPYLLKIFQDRCQKIGARFNRVRASGPDDYTTINKNLALAIARDLGLSDKNISKGLQNFKIPGRFEIMQQGPLVILDGAHNELKMNSVLYNLKKTNYRKLHLIVLVPFIKTLEKTLALIIPKADQVYYVTEYSVPKYKNFRTYSAKQALNLAFKQAGRRDLILATGSFQLIGELRKFWYSEKYILEKRQSF